MRGEKERFSRVVLLPGPGAFHTRGSPSALPFVRPRSNPGERGGTESERLFSDFGHVVLIALNWHRAPAPLAPPSSRPSPPFIAPLFSSVHPILPCAVVLPRKSALRGAGGVTRLRERVNW